MPVVVVVNPKGGVGKSTVSTNVAGYFASKGAQVMLGDVDKQQTSRWWLEHRPANANPIHPWDIDDDHKLKVPKGVTHVVLDTPAGLHGKLLERVLKLSTRVIVPVQPSMFDMLATRQFLAELLSEKAIRKGRADVAVIGMRVDARTRAAGELERFFAGFELPVLAYLRDTQVYVQATAAGMTLFDLPPSRAERDIEQWQAIIDWAERGEPVVGD